MIATGLPLRDVHLPAAPALWPPAPGWWLLAVALVLVVLVLWVLVLAWLRRRRRQRGWLALFDQQLAVAPNAAARIATASELLRRAARDCAPEAAQLQGEPWLHFLNGDTGHDFSAGAGRLLLDGGFRRDVDEVQAARACALARQRFAGLLQGRR